MTNQSNPNLPFTKHQILYVKKVSFQLDADIGIPNHVYDAAAELFLNHLKKHYAAQLLTGGSSQYPLKNQAQMKNMELIFHHPLNLLGKTCPLYYKKKEAPCNA